MIHFSLYKTKLQVKFLFELLNCMASESEDLESQASETQASGDESIDSTKLS